MQHLGNFRRTHCCEHQLTYPAVAGMQLPSVAAHCNLTTIITQSREAIAVCAAIQLIINCMGWAVTHLP